MKSIELKKATDINISLVAMLRDDDTVSQYAVVRGYRSSRPMYEQWDSAVGYYHDIVEAARAFDVYENPVQTEAWNEDAPPV